MKGLPLPLLALLVLALTPAVDSQQDWAYYGASIGEFDYSQEVILGQEPFADSADSWRLMIGYQFMKHLAVEGAYGKTSTVRDTATFSSPLAPGSVELGLETELSKILTLRLLGTLPFDNGLSLMAGLAYAEFDQELVFSVAGVPQIGGELSDGRFAYYFGVQYDWDRVALRLGYEKLDFEDVRAFTFTGEVDAEEVSLTFFYKI